MKKTQDEFSSRLKTELEKFDAGKNFPQSLSRENIERLLKEQAPDKKKKPKVIPFGRSGLAIAASVALILTAGIVLRYSGVFDPPNVSPAQNSAEQSGNNAGKRAYGKIFGGDNTDAAQAGVTKGEKDANTNSGGNTAHNEDAAATKAKEKPSAGTKSIGSENLNSEEVVSYFNNEGNNPEVAKLIEQAVIAEKNEETTTATDPKNNSSAAAANEGSTSVTTGNNALTTEAPMLSVTKKSSTVKSGGFSPEQSESDTAELRLSFGDGYEFVFTRGLYGGVYYGADMQLYRGGDHVKQSECPGVFDMTVYINGKALSAQASKGGASYVCYEQSSASGESAEDISVRFEVTFDSAADAQSFAESLIECGFKTQISPAFAGEFYSDTNTVTFVW